ncbi:MAG TPA: molybdopterin dehydrogenase [Sphaerochaeta sp.]|nr:molybdopterin dehydrogenase [Sphaerochaeta sp.]
MLDTFAYKAPQSKELLLDMLATGDSEVKLLSGGTDLLVNIRNGVYHPKVVVDLKKIPGFDAITWDKRAGLTIGPSVTINAILTDVKVQQHFPLLCACAKDLASYQIRNRATVVGNIVNASPCSDMAPALLCLDATIIIESRQGKREIPIAEFFTGVKRTVLRQDEVVTSIHIPSDKAGVQGVYRKLKRIQGHDLGIVGVAIANFGNGARIAVSSSAPTPVVTPLLPLDLSVPKVLQAVNAIIRPISDVRCSQEYRSFMVGEYTKRLWKEVIS